MIKRRGGEPSDLAPHAEPQWVDEFVLEQRLLEVPGSRIGDALATVEAHLAETGESAADAFGPPRQYARLLAESEATVVSRGLSAGTVVSGVSGMAGIVLLPTAFQAWLEKDAVTVTTGDLVMVAALAALSALLVAFCDQVLRLLLARQTPALLMGPLLVVLFVAITLLWRAPVTALPSLAVLVFAVIALAVSSGLGWRERVDLVQSPSGQTLGSARLTRVLTVSMAPLVAVSMCLVLWVSWVLL